jgi:hypothetical protein
MNTNNSHVSPTDKALEEEFALAFGLLSRCPEVTEIDFGAQSLPGSFEIERLEQLSQRYGLELHRYESGRVTVRRPPRNDSDRDSALGSPRLLEVTSREISHLAHGLEQGVGAIRTHVKAFDARFEGLREGIR